MGEDGDDPWDEFGEQGRCEEDELKRLVERDRVRDRVRDLDRYRRRCGIWSGWSVPAAAAGREAGATALVTVSDCCGGSTAAAVVAPGCVFASARCRMGWAS